MGRCLIMMHGIHQVFEQLDCDLKRYMDRMVKQGLLTDEVIKVSNGELMKLGNGCANGRIIFYRLFRNYLENPPWGVCL